MNAQRFFKARRRQVVLYDRAGFYTSKFLKKWLTLVSKDLPGGYSEIINEELLLAYKKWAEKNPEEAEKLLKSCGTNLSAMQILPSKMPERLVLLSPVPPPVITKAKPGPKPLLPSSLEEELKQRNPKSPS